METWKVLFRFDGVGHLREYKQDWVMQYLVDVDSFFDLDKIQFDTVEFLDGLVSINAWLANSRCRLDIQHVFQQNPELETHDLCVRRMSMEDTDLIDRCSIVSVILLRELAHLVCVYSRGPCLYHERRVQNDDEEYGPNPYNANRWIVCENRNDSQDDLCGVHRNTIRSPFIIRHELRVIPGYYEQLYKDVQAKIPTGVRNPLAFSKKLPDLALEKVITKSLNRLF
jgi:hypothetical protein